VVEAHLLHLISVLVADDKVLGEAQKLTLAEALSKEGLTEKAQGKLSALTGEERIRVLRHMGTEAVQDDPHSCLPSVIEHLSPDWSQKETILHNPNNPFQFPIIRKNALFVRECYHGLYNLAIKVPIDDYDSRTLLTGTPGIGKSTFLIYFIIRWLYESTRAPDSSNNPAATFQNDEQSVTSSSRMRDVLIFQPAVSGNTFYAFARPNIVRMGTYTDFWHFFLLPTTWYLVDWKPKSKPINNVAPTLFALSPNSIQDEDFKEYEKVLSLRLCMPVWTYDELEQCRHYVYPNLSGESLKYIYERVGGVPRSCLQAPTKALRRGHTEKEAHAAGLKRLEDAFARVKDPSYVLRAQEESLGFR
jgi:hypothetical protein